MLGGQWLHGVTSPIPREICLSWSSRYKALHVGPHDVSSLSLEAAHPRSLCNARARGCRGGYVAACPQSLPRRHFTPVPVCSAVSNLLLLFSGHCHGQPGPLLHLRTPPHLQTSCSQQSLPQAPGLARTHGGPFPPLITWGLAQDWYRVRCLGTNRLRTKTKVPRLQW